MENLTYYHNYSYPFIQRINDSIKIRIAIESPGDILSIELLSLINNEATKTTMKYVTRTNNINIYETSLHIDFSNNIQKYIFKVIHADDVLWISAIGITHSEPLLTDFFSLLYEPNIPEWYFEQQFYQIFPDRFASDKSTENNQFPDAKIIENDDIYSFFGGNLNGIKNKITYLKKLGVTAIYLNPICISNTNHHYDVKEYNKIDPRLGTDSDFQSLVDDLHKNNIKIILDAPINHVSNESIYYDESNNTSNGAANNSNSPYKKFFTFKDGKPIYWNNCKYLIKLNYGCKDVQKLIYGKEGYLTHYLKKPFNIDGWRLDANHMIGKNGTANNNAHYCNKIYKSIKKVNKEAIIIGDHYHDAHNWLCGNIEQEDGAMNIQGFYKPLILFLTGKDFSGCSVKYDATNLKFDICKYYQNIPQELQLSFFNQLGNHDTSRLATKLNNNPILIKMALTILYTWIGVPCLYYGDEIGFQGNSSLSSRNPMEWIKQNEKYVPIIKVLSEFRKRNKALMLGSFQITFANEKCFVYERCYKDQKIIVIVNKGNNVINVDLSYNLKGIKIANVMECMQKDSSVKSCLLKPKMSHDAIILDNIRIMPYSNLEDSTKINIGPLSVLIID